MNSQPKSITAVIPKMVKKMPVPSTDHFNVLSSSGSSSDAEAADDRVLACAAPDRCTLSMENIIADGVGRSRRAVRERLVVSRAEDGTPRLANVRLLQ